MHPFVVRMRPSCPEWRFLSGLELMRCDRLQPFIVGRKATYGYAAAAEPCELVRRQSLDNSHAVIWCSRGETVVSIDDLCEDGEEWGSSVNLVRAQAEEDHQLLVLPQGTRFSIAPLNLFNGRYAYAPVCVIVAFFTLADQRPDKLKAIKRPDQPELRERVRERIERFHQELATVPVRR